MDIEVWKDIPHYEGLYAVSNFGKVKGVERTVVVLDWRKKRIIKEKILQASDYNGYKSYVLSKENKTRTFSAHKLVAMVFLNRDPNNKDIVVDHIDSNPSNNNVSNLQLISHRENIVRSINKTHLPIGVHYHKKNNTWVSKISVLGKREYLGSFRTPELASEAYEKRKKEALNITFNK